MTDTGTGPVTTVSIDWADGTHNFKLGMDQLRELEEKTDSGPLALFNRIANGAWRIVDLRETLRLGLIGAGLEPTKALALVRSYVDKRPWVESVGPAQLVLGACLFGVERAPADNGDADRPVESAEPPHAG